MRKTFNTSIFVVSAVLSLLGLLIGYIIHNNLLFQEHGASNAIRAVRDVRSRDYLASWVEHTLSTNPKPILVQPKRSGPGEMEIIGSFDWTLINVDPSSPEKQIRLVCLPDDTPIAVYFGEGARVGILVSIRQGFGVEDSSLVYHDGRFAVYAPGVRVGVGL